jgi:hypothetical protein
VALEWRLARGSLELDDLSLHQQKLSTGSSLCRSRSLYSRSRPSVTARKKNRDDVPPVGPEHHDQLRAAGMHQFVAKTLTPGNRGQVKRRVRPRVHCPPPPPHPPTPTPPVEFAGTISPTLLLRQPLGASPLPEFQVRRGAISQLGGQIWIFCRIRFLY